MVGEKYLYTSRFPDKMNVVLYRFRNSLYLKDNEVDLKLTE